MAEFLLELADAAAQSRVSAELGGKAVNLAKLHAAGLPVPAAVVIPAWVRPPRNDQGRAIPQDVASALREACLALGDSLIARSSASIEDTANSSAAGVFASTPADGAEAIAAAVCSVWDSTESETAVAYAAARGIDPAAIGMSVIVQRRIDAAHHGVIYTRAPGRPGHDTVLIEVNDLISEAGRDGIERHRDLGFALDSAAVTRITAAAIEAESAIGASHGADVEWLLDGDDLWLVQARPIVHPAPVGFEAVRVLLAETDWGDDDDRVWRWDVTHNPEPLSPAQAGLVRYVCERGAAPSPMRVVGGYLYVADAEIDTAPPMEADGGTTLARFFADDVVPEIEAALAPVEGATPSSLADALVAYERMYRCYARSLSPALANARTAVRNALSNRPAELLGSLLASGARSLDALLGGAARGTISEAELVERAAPLSIAWDVAAPTYADHPELLRTAIDRFSQSTSPGPDFGAIDPDILELAATIRRIGSADDLLFARGQQVVRRALLHLGQRAGLTDAGDIFYLPLERVIAAESESPSSHWSTWASTAASQGRQRHREQANRTMPLAIRGGLPLHVTYRPSDTGSLRGRGVGVGRRARGRIARLQAWGPAEPVPTESIVLSQTLTPASVFLLHGARGLICEHGGLLGHGAAIARELGLPCVVGCTGAWGALADGDLVLVDGAAGLVLRLPDGD